MVDASWRIILTNPALCAWWGDGGEQLAGQEVRFGTPADAAISAEQASALTPDPAVFTGSVLQTKIVHPRDPAQQLEVQWVPLLDAAGEVEAAVAWATRAVATEQGSPARITATTDWHALLAEHRTRVRERGQAKLSRFVGESLSMSSLRLLADRATWLDCAVWIHGPEGSGRRTLARTIHASDLNAIAFAEMDASLLTPELLQRQLAEFSATLAKLPTKPAAAQHANLLLTNVERLALGSLADLEAFLDRQRVRLLLTSNGPPQDFLNANWPAEKIAVWSVHTIEIPPLSSRLSDLPVLVQHLIEELNGGNSKQLRGCSLAALELLAAYRWPGEAAELTAILRAAHAAADGIDIQPADLPSWLRQAESALSSPRTPPQPIDLDQQLAEIERELLARALRLAGGNKTQAAKLVGWTRNRLLRRAEELRLISEPAPKSTAAEPEFIPDLPFEPEEE